MTVLPSERRMIGLERVPKLAVKQSGATIVSTHYPRGIFSGEWSKMVEEEEDKEEVLYSYKIIVVNINFQEHNVHIMQDRQTKSHTIISTYCQTKKKATLTAEVHGMRWHSERLNMNSRLAYPNPEWVNKARYAEAYQIPRFTAYNNEGCPRRHLLRFLAECGNTVFTIVMVLNQFLLSLQGVAENWFFTLPRLCIANWDILASNYIGRSTRLNPST